MAFCSQCGRPLAADARFCAGCGSPVADAGTQPSSGLDEERKLATVLFADLVGSTALAGGQDPERTRAVLNRFYDAMAEEISDAGGTVEKFVGDAVMAAFGAPAAREDHAERALHAALSMRARLRTLFGDALALRIGVNTGEVVVGRAREGGSFVSGDAVNMAARLEQAAEPGEILVGERTASAVAGAFDIGEATTVAAKGKPSGLVAHRLRGALARVRPRGIDDLPRAFVGRYSELEALRATYARAVELERPRLVTVVGDAGVGKTTLLRELWRWLEAQSPEPVRRVGRCLPYGQGIAYLPLGEIVREQLGLSAADAPEVVQRRLGDRELLGPLLGLEAPADLHPLVARDRLQGAWVAFLEELVVERPAVILVEDLYWADPALLELLEAAATDVRGALLVIGTARPEFVHVRPGWGARVSGAETIQLGALPAPDTDRLLEALVPVDLPEALRRLVVSRAEGNPFFVEELVRTLIDQDVLERRNGGWVVHDLSLDFEVPDTVQAVLSARIDLLEPAEKAALQAAALIGRTFWSGPVYELVEGLEPDLRVLEERGFVRHRAGSALAGEREWVIAHALTREVAYGSLPKARRARLHARFAGWLERAGGGRDEHAALLAHHYAEAVRPEDADLAWPNEEARLRELAERAVVWLRRAAELAVGRYELDDAVALLERAAGLETSVERQVEIWRAIGHAHALYFNGAAFAAAMQRAIELAPDDATAGELYAELVLQTLVRAGMWGVAPDAALVDGWIARALELAGENDAARAKALIARGYADYEKSPALAAEAGDLAERTGDPALRSYAHDVRALTAFVARDFDESLRWHHRRLALVDELDDPDHRADVFTNAIAPAVALGRFDEARRYAIAHAEVTVELSPHHRLHGVSAQLELDELLGDWQAAASLQTAIEQAVADNVSTPCVRNQRSLLVCALAQSLRGDEGEARRLEEAAEEHAMTGYGTVLDTPRLRLALHRGDLDAAAKLLGEPPVRRSNWFYLSSMAAHLDALAALGDRAGTEDAAGRALQPGTYVEPFALRALGVVREDAALVERAAERFDALGLAWHAARTRAAA